MDRRLSVTMLAMFVGGAACAGLARADIYTWVDASGIVNYSDNPPPKGVQAIGVARDIALRNAAPADPAAAREAAQQAEMQAMAERIRMLEREVDQAGRQAPPLQYAAAPPPSGYGCDPAWSDCGYGWGASIFPPAVVVVSTPRFHHHFFARQSFRHSFAPHSFQHAGGGFRRH